MLNNLQVLRALAAILVVLAHIASLNYDALSPWLGWGGHGVDLFFVISGFVMVYTTADKPITPRQFMLNRIVRIVPIYWVMTLAIFCVALAAPTLLLTTQANWIDLAKSLLFVPFERSDGLVVPVLAVGWSLNYEMFFYALFALSLTLPSFAVRTWAMVGGLAALVTVGALARPTATAPAFYTDAFLIEFAFGMVLAYHRSRADFRAWSRLWPFLLLAAAACAIGYALAFEPALHPAILWGTSSALIVWAALIFEAQGRSYVESRLLLIGAASYALYLSHPFVFFPLQAIATQAGLTAGPALFPMAAIALAVILPAAVLLHLFLERPATAWLRARLGGEAAARRWSDALALWPWRRTRAGKAHFTA